jgi:hypothetical protein
LAVLLLELKAMVGFMLLLLLYQHLPHHRKRMLIQWLLLQLLLLQLLLLLHPQLLI